MRTKGMRSTWRPSASSYRVKAKLMATGDEGTSSSGLLPQVLDEEDEVFFRMTRFQDKMRNAEERYAEKQQDIVGKWQSRSNYVSQKLDSHHQSMRLKWQDTFARDVNKLENLKKKNETREKLLNEASESLQDQHRHKLEKL